MHTQLLAKNKPSATVDDFFVPELCQPEALLSMVLLAELLVLVLVLAEPMTPSPANDTGKVDGRVLRGERTRARIVDALINLIREGSLVPRAVDIAGRAGVSVRSVFQHFADFRELYLAAADRAVENVIPLLTDIPVDQPLDIRIEQFIDELGSPKTYNHYPTGWAWAFNTPFKMWKRYNFEGGVADPLVISWPAGIKAKGELRKQFMHATDVVPTLYDLLGVELPESVKGYQQIPLEGVTFRSTFEDASAPTPSS